MRGPLHRRGCRSADVFGCWRRRRRRLVMSWSLAEYLTSARAALSSLGKGDSVRVTIGNESCDLDSIVCAISHAHYQSQLQPELVSLAILQCSRADFDLRSDAVWLLSQLQLDPSQLIFLEEVVGQLQALQSVSVTLVDHATPTGPLLTLSNAEVVGVIDHHHHVPSEALREGSVVEPVGSCATLVAERLLGNERYHMPHSVATLLLGAILLDTVGLDRNAGRLTDKDLAMAEKLGAVVDMSSSELYSSLSAARLSTAGLSAHQILRRDLKCVLVAQSQLGFSSVTCSLSEELLEREDTAAAVDSLCQSLTLAALVVLGVSVRGDTVSREVAIFQPEGSDVADAVAGLLETDKDLQCERAPCPSCILLQQGNTRMSRKHILPLVTDFLSSLYEEEDRVEGPTHCSPGTEQTHSHKESAVEAIPEYSYEEEVRDVRSHRLVTIAEEGPSLVEMAVVRPYQKIIQHGGYVTPERQAVLVISACYLPPRSLPDYEHTAEQLFLYLMSVVQRLVVDKYQIVYLHSGAPQHSMPSISILRRFYLMVDHRLRKQLQCLYIVHPTFWVRSMLRLARPFISSKFYRKVCVVRHLDQLPVALDHSLIPAPVVRADAVSQSRSARPSDRYSANPPL